MHENSIYTTLQRWSYGRKATEQALFLKSRINVAIKEKGI